MVAVAVLAVGVVAVATVAGTAAWLLESGR